MKHGFIKVAAAAPEIRVADPMFNADAVIRAMDEHARLGVKVLVFPELALTGATCGDLFYQNSYCHTHCYCCHNCQPGRHTMADHQRNRIK